MIEHIDAMFIETGQVIQVKRLLNKALEDDIQNKTREEIFNIQFIGEGYRLMESEKLRKMAQNWESTIVKSGIYNIHNDRIKESTSKRKIKIGYFSGDFNSHPVGRFLYPLVREHNYGQFEIYLLNTGSNYDDMTDRFKELPIQWVELCNLSSLEGACKIRDIKLDILVELSGYTDQSRIDMLCHKPVKIQMSYLGYFAPTYLNCIDYWIGDRILFENLNATYKKDHELIRVKEAIWHMRIKATDNKCRIK